MTTSFHFESVMKLSLKFEEKIEVCSIGEGNKPIKVFFISCNLLPLLLF